MFESEKTKTPDELAAYKAMCERNRQSARRAVVTKRATYTCWPSRARKRRKK